MELLGESIRLEWTTDTEGKDFSNVSTQIKTMLCESETVLQEYARAGASVRVSLMSGEASWLEYHYRNTLPDPPRLVRKALNTALIQEDLPVRIGGFTRINQRTFTFSVIAT